MKKENNKKEGETITKEEIIKDLKKQQFLLSLNKDNIIRIIKTTLSLNDDYITKNIKMDNKKIINNDDLIIKINESSMLIKTSIYNETIKTLKKEGKFYKRNQSDKEYIININLEDIYNETYKIIKQKYLEKLKQTFKEKNLDEGFLLDMIITGLTNDIIKKN